MKFSRLCAMLVAAGIISGAQAASLFSVIVNVGGQTTTASFTSFEHAVDVLSTSGLRSLVPSYTGVEAATITLNLRGLTAVASYTTANSTRLVFTVSSLGITEAFQGATRDASEQQLEDFLKKNGNDILSRMGKEFARVSPVDPIAGNPNSLMSQLVAQDFNTSFTDVSNIAAPPRTSGAAGQVERVGNFFGIGPRYSQYRQDGLTSKAFSLPLSYTFRNDLDPRIQTSFSIPITLTDTEGAKGYSVGLSGAYRFPINDNWALRPAVSLAAAGSIDLGSAAAVASVSVTSTYLIPMGATELGIGNMVGYYSTLKVSSGDYSYNPKISNTVFRNGILFSHAVGDSSSMEWTLVDTYFSGSELYIKHYDEVGVSIGTNRSARSARAYFRCGANYLTSSKSKGFNVYLNYYF